MDPIVFKSKKIGVLGDPHLGKRFVHDVPMHRRGEREQLVRECFADHFLALKGQDLAVHVCMGDIFDRPIVPPETIALAADYYKIGVCNNPDTLFVLLAGNHDISRDLTTVNSFDILRRIIEPLGVMVIRDFADNVVHQGLELGFCPWSPDRTSREVAETLGRVDLAFGHWDVVNPSTDVNLVPDNLQADLIVTGHDHRARIERDGKLIVTGSMQPYAHGEGGMYRTLTLSELETVSVEERRGLCLRVVLNEGEVIPDDLDALQIQAMRPEQIEDDGGMTVGFEGLDMATLWEETLVKHGVDQGLRVDLFEKYRNRA